jgi:hypothetical protein
MDWGSGDRSRRSNAVGASMQRLSYRQARLAGAMHGDSSRTWRVALTAGLPGGLEAYLETRDKTRNGYLMVTFVERVELLGTTILRCR